MHSLGTTTVSRAVSIALRTTANITAATNNPVPVTCGARDGTYENRRFTHSLGGFTVTVGKKFKQCRILVAETLDQLTSVVWADWPVYVPTTLVDLEG